MTLQWLHIDQAPKNSPGDDLVLWLPPTSSITGRAVTGGFWNDDRYARKPRPFWDSSSSARKSWMRDHQPTHFMHTIPGPDKLVPPAPLRPDQLFANDALMELNAELGLNMAQLTALVRIVEQAHGIGEGA